MFMMLACVIAVRADIVDRIAVTVGNQVITEGQIVEELRVAAFLNHQPVELSPAKKREAADRLIEQMLLKRDMDVAHFPAAPETGVDKMETEIRESYPSNQAFEQDLASHGVTESELREHLLWQMTLLSYIEYRFQPAVQISDGEVRQYYDKKRQEWEQQHAAKIPTLEESKADIDKILTQQHVDQAVDRWLGDARTQVEIVYRKEAFQ